MKVKNSGRNRNELKSLEIRRNLDLTSINSKLRIKSQNNTITFRKPKNTYTEITNLIDSENFKNKKNYLNFLEKENCLNSNLTIKENFNSNRNLLSDIRIIEPYFEKNVNDFNKITDNKSSMYNTTLVSNKDKIVYDHKILAENYKSSLFPTVIVKKYIGLKDKNLLEICKNI